MLSCSVSNTRTTGGRKETVGRFQAAHMRSPRKGSHSVKTVLETPTRRCATLCHGYSLKILSFWARDIIPMCWPNSTSLDFILLKVCLRCWSGHNTHPQSSLCSTNLLACSSQEAVAGESLAASGLYSQVGEMLLSTPGQKIYVPCHASLGSWTEIRAAESSQRTVKNSAYPLCIMH